MEPDKKKELDDQLAVRPNDGRAGPSTSMTETRDLMLLAKTVRRT